MVVCFTYIFRVTAIHDESQCVMRLACRSVDAFQSPMDETPHVHARFVFFKGFIQWEIVLLEVGVDGFHEKCRLGKAPDGKWRMSTSLNPRPSIIESSRFRAICNKQINFNIVL